MKTFFLFLFLAGSMHAHAQKYILLDTHIAAPARFSDKITANDKFKGFFPVKKAAIPKFIAILEEIVDTLSSSHQLYGKPKQYSIGCLQFKGIRIPVGKAQRLDYVITSSCDNINISMHLSNAKLKMASNAYFIKTWIKYIKASLQQ